MTRLRFALSGILAALAGIAFGHLVAAFVNPSASPVLAIGSTVIDLTPTPVKEWAIATFGTNDKLILQGSVFVVTLLLAGVAGMLSQRRRAIGVALIALLVGVAGAAALSRPTASALDALPALVTLAVGIATLLFLLRWAEGATAEQHRDADEHDQEHHAAGASRRGFLFGAGGITLGAALVGVGAQLKIGAQSVAKLALPQPKSAAKALPTGLETKVKGISPLQTPTATFYRVDTNLTVPQINLDRWSLEVGGMVEKPFTLTFDELSAMPLIERDITMTCVSNEVGGSYVGAARWLGVRLTDVLDRAELRGRPDQVLSTAVDGFTISTPLSAVMDGRDAMIAIGMNGESLTDTHGFPARLITPGLYGFVGATKWLTKLTLTTYAAEQSYWTKRQWATDAPIKTSARVDTPTPLSTIPAGMTAIGGVAWAQYRGVATVQVRIDDGDWQDSTLGPDVGIDYWRQWYLPWDAKPGLHRLSVRAVDRDGDVQIAKRATPFPSGSSGIQEVVVTVA